MADVKRKVKTVTQAQLDSVEGKAWLRGYVTAVTSMARYFGRVSKGDTMPVAMLRDVGLWKQRNGAKAVHDGKVDVAALKAAGVGEYDLNILRKL